MLAIHWIRGTDQAVTGLDAPINFVVRGRFPLEMIHQKPYENLSYEMILS